MATVFQMAGWNQTLSVFDMKLQPGATGLSYWTGSTGTE